MTTLLPDLGTARRTRLRVELVPGGPVLVRSESTGDAMRPGLRPMLLDRSADTARICLVPDGALLLAGDAVLLDVEVGPGARLELVEPTGTVAYDMRGGSARWDVAVAVEDGGSLLWAGEPFVVAAGARVTRSTSVALGTDARAALRETLVLGRSGERGGRLEQLWTATGPAGELLVESLVLDDAVHRPGILGGNRVVGSVVALGWNVPSGDADPSRMDLDDGGSVWRRLAGDAHAAEPQEAWRAVLRDW